VFVPELPDVITEGDTREEALAMAKDAIDSYLEAMRGHGWEIHLTETSRVTANA